MVYPWRVIANLPNRIIQTATIKVNPVFNVSLLNKFQGKCILPGPIIVDEEAEYELEKIIRQRGNGKHRQYLVRWLAYDESEDCWMEEDE